MPSPRRMRALMYIAIAGIVTLLFFTSQARHSREADTRSIEDFYHKTVNAMDRGRRSSIVGQQQQQQQQQVIPAHDHDADGDIDEDDEIMAKQMAERLRQAEQKAKDSANAKAPNKPDAPKAIVGVGSSASGQHKGEPDEKGNVEETAEEHEVEVELNTILKKSPVIIFSKSYCPYSKRAKGILLDKYVIEPAPFVVELDKHPLWPQIQARLGEMTGRRTVPNVMIFGKSIGGGDDIAALDTEKKLADKIRQLGNKRVEITQRFVENAAKVG